MTDAAVAAPINVSANHLPTPGLCWVNDKLVVVYLHCKLRHQLVAAQYDETTGRWEDVALHPYAVVEPYDPTRRQLPPGLVDQVKYLGLTPEVEPTKTQYAFSCRTSSQVDQFAGNICKGRPTSASITVAGHPEPAGGPPLEFNLLADQRGLTLSANVVNGGARGQTKFTYPQLLAFIESKFDPKKDL